MVQWRGEVEGEEGGGRGRAEEWKGEGWEESFDLIFCSNVFMTTSHLFLLSFLSLPHTLPLSFLLLIHTLSPSPSSSSSTQVLVHPAAPGAGQ